MPVKYRPSDVEHLVLERPVCTATLWRYMDFAKFVAMLVNKGLYLSRLDRLGDSFEGWVPEPSNMDHGPCVRELCMEQDQELRQQSETLKHDFYVNCWHGNDDESDAMWKVYAKGDGGIAVQTTGQKLKDSLENSSKELWFYKVTYYKDRPIHGGSMLRACLAKRKPFEHENEVRIIWRKPCDESGSCGFYVECNLTTLIETVWLGPTAPLWFKRIAEDVLKRYGIEAEVKQSCLGSKPP